MNNKFAIVMNIVLIAIGAAILWFSHSPAGLRGAVYMALCNKRF